MPSWPISQKNANAACITKLTTIIQSHESLFLLSYSN